MVSTFQGSFGREDGRCLVGVDVCARELEAQGWVVHDDGDVVAAEEVSRRPTAWDDVLGLRVRRRALAVSEEDAEEAEDNEEHAVVTRLCPLILPDLLAR